MGPIAFATSFAPWANVNNATENIKGIVNNFAIDFLLFSIFLPYLERYTDTKKNTITATNIQYIEASANDILIIFLKPFSIKYAVKAQDIIATYTGTSFFAYFILLVLCITSTLILYKNNAAMIHPITGETTQLNAIFHIVDHDTIPKPIAAIQPHITQPTMECVVETGALKYVAIFNQTAAANNADSITKINAVGSLKFEISIIPFLTVFTTSQPAINAHKIFQTAAINIAHFNFNAPDQTAGPTLFATSFAQILIAIYVPSHTADNKKIAFVIVSSIVSPKKTETITNKKYNTAPKYPINIRIESKVSKFANFII